jgi:hypothetical protein
MPQRQRPFLRAALGLCAFFTACSSIPQPVQSVQLPDRGQVSLEPAASFDSPAINESSGLAASRRFPGLYWTHNDSGDTAVIFAVDGQGRLVGKPVRLLGATNVDWEDIAADGAGNLWIGDFGNNLNSRTDLCLYVLPEPDPKVEEKVRVTKRIAIRFPDQSLFPPPRWEYDAEALFIAFGKPYVLTKHRGSSTTKLYRLDQGDDGFSAPLTLLGTFDIGGMVTAAVGGSWFSPTTRSGSSRPAPGTTTSAAGSAGFRSGPDSARESASTPTGPSSWTTSRASSSGCRRRSSWSSGNDRRSL